jgi:hypothetical protein
MPEEPIFPEDPIQWMYREWRKSIEGTPTDQVLDLIEGGARTVEGFIQGVREAGEGVQRDLQAWATDPGRKLEELRQVPGLVVAGWGAMLKPVADGLASARTLLEQVLAGIRTDPTLTLSVDPQNLADLHAAASALERVVEASQRLHRAALGLAEGAGLASDEVWNAWAGLMMAGAEGPAQTLARVFHEASRFMVDVLARNGQSGNPVAYYPPIRIPPAFSKPRVPLIVVAVAELPGRLGAMEKAREELAEAVGGLRLALSRLETWEGYARLGFRDGVDQAYAVLERFVGPVMMGILNEARPLPSMAQEMASTISRIAPVDTSVLRLYSPPHGSIVDASWRPTCSTSARPRRSWPVRWREAPGPCGGPGPCGTAGRRRMRWRAGAGGPGRWWAGRPSGSCPFCSRCGTRRSAMRSRPRRLWSSARGR